jgi:hypothetical protein
MRWSQDGLQLEGTSTQGWVLPQDLDGDGKSSRWTKILQW